MKTPKGKLIAITSEYQFECEGKEYFVLQETEIGGVHTTTILDPNSNRVEDPELFEKINNAFNEALIRGDIKGEITTKEETNDGSINGNKRS